MKILNTEKRNIFSILLPNLFILLLVSAFEIILLLIRSGSEISTTTIIGTLFNGLVICVPIFISSLSLLLPLKNLSKYGLFIVFSIISYFLWFIIYGHVINTTIEGFGLLGLMIYFSAAAIALPLIFSTVQLFSNKVISIAMIPLVIILLMGIFWGVNHDMQLNSQKLNPQDIYSSLNAITDINKAVEYCDSIHFSDPWPRRLCFSTAAEMVWDFKTYDANLHHLDKSITLKPETVKLLCDNTKNTGSPSDVICPDMEKFLNKTKQPI